MAITPSWLKTKIRTEPTVRGAVASGKTKAPTDKGQYAEHKRRKQKARALADARGSRDGMLGLEVAVEDEPSHCMKLKYEEFARQFLVDFSQTRTAVRMGYSKNHAPQIGNDIFWRPYTQAYLVKLIREIEEHTIVCRNEVLAGLLREAHNFNADANSGTRIKAWTEIGKILGMFVQRVELSANSSGVMEVPMVVDADQWEHLAQPAQNLLSEVVRK